MSQLRKIGKREGERIKIEKKEKEEKRTYKRRWREGIARVWEQSVKPEEGGEEEKAF